MLYDNMQCVVFHLSLHLIHWLPQTKNTMSNILLVPFFLPPPARRAHITNITQSLFSFPLLHSFLPRNAQGVIVPFSSSSWRSIGIKGTNASTLSATWSTRWIASADRLMVVGIHWNSFLLECQDQLQTISKSVHNCSGREWTRVLRGRRSRDSSDT